MIHSSIFHNSQILQGALRVGKIKSLNTLSLYLGSLFCGDENGIPPSFSVEDYITLPGLKGS